MDNLKTIGPIKYLLVEDDDDHAKIISRTLEHDKVPNTIVRVKDGVEAIEYLTKEGRFAAATLPDVILLDLKLPKKDGIEVLSEIKAENCLCTIPVVILTTSDAESDKLMAYKNHANSYLVKPLNAEVFKKLIGELSLYWGELNRNLNIKVPIHLAEGSSR